VLLAACSAGRPEKQAVPPTHVPARRAVYVFQITPSQVQLNPGQTQQFTTTIRDALGNPVPLIPTYSATGGTITSYGLYRAGATAGTFRVTAKAGGGWLSAAASILIGQAPKPPDQVTLALPAQPPPALPVVLLDANVGGGAPCVNDDHHTGSVVFPNWLARGACPPDEIAAFARGAAAQILDGTGGNGQIWSNAAGETQAVNLQAPRLSMPVEFWVVDQFYRLLVNGTWQDLSVETAGLAAFQHANDWYNTSRAGIRFEPTTAHRVWNDAAAKAQLGCITSGNEVICRCTTTLYASPYFVSGRLNVYFVDQVLYQSSKVMGVTCRDPSSTSNDPQAGNVILLSSTQMSLATLGHELGHALSLGHTGAAGGSFYQDANGVDLFDPYNLMWIASEESFAFSLGQAFRMNIETLSQLNLNGVRTTGPQRACECRPSTPGCNYKAEASSDGVCPRITRVW
jgi:hypothetical protein